MKWVLEGMVMGEEGRVRGLLVRLRENWMFVFLGRFLRCL